MTGAVLTGLFLDARAQAPAPLPSKAVANKVKVRVVLPALKSLHEINKAIADTPTQEELEKVLMTQSVLSDNDYNCLAIMSHTGEMLACAPPAMAPLVKRTSDMHRIIGHMQERKGAFFRESPNNPRGYRTYDLFLPIHEGGAFTNEVIGVYYARIYPARFLRDTAATLELPDNESFYILSKEGEVIFSSVADDESPVGLLKSEYRSTRSSMRTLFKRMKREPEGRSSYASMADFFIGLLQHNISWTHMELPGTTWIVLHDSIVPAQERDAINPLTGVWEAYRPFEESPEKASPPALFDVSLIQEDTWWSMRGGGTNWPFRAEGRFLEDRMLSNRINQLDDRNQVVFSLQGRYDESRDEIFLEIYRQHKRRVITTPCVLKRLPPKQESHEKNLQDIRFRVSPGSLP